MVTIDGDEIVSGSTIDGDEISEITMDGDVVWTALTIIDDFSSGSISEYTSYTNDGADWNINSSSESEIGGNVLRGDDEGDTFSDNILASELGDGLSNYPSPGDEIEYRINSVDGDDRFGFVFGIENIDSYDSIDGYTVFTHPEDDYIRLVRMDDERPTNAPTLDESSISLSNDEWYKVNIDWEVGDISVTLLNDSGSTLTTLHSNDSNYEGRGFGWFFRYSSSGGVEWDYAKIL